MHLCFNDPIVVEYLQAMPPRKKSQAVEQLLLIGIAAQKKLEKKSSSDAAQNAHRENRRARDVPPPLERAACSEKVSFDPAALAEAVEDGRTGTVEDGRTDAVEDAEDGRTEDGQVAEAMEVAEAVEDGQVAEAMEAVEDGQVAEALPKPPSSRPRTIVVRKNHPPSDKIATKTAPVNDVTGFLKGFD